MKKKLLFGTTLATIDIGGIDHQQLIVGACARDMRINLSEAALEVLQKTENLKKRIQVELVGVKLRIAGGLPVVSKGKTLRPMIEEAFDNDLCLCPPSTCLEVLDQLPQGFLQHEFALAMEPVLCSMGIPGWPDEPVLLTIEDRKREGNYPEGHWMLTQPVVRSVHTTPACMDTFSDGGTTYLFCRRSRALVKVGYDKLGPSLVL